MQQTKAAHEGLCQRMKEILGDRVEKVGIGERLTESPCVLVTGEFGWSANMERVMKAQALRDPNLTRFMISKKTLELNPLHPIVKGMKKRFDRDQTDSTLTELTIMIYETALLTSGFSLNDPNLYAKRIHKVIQSGLNVEEEQKTEMEKEMGSEMEKDRQMGREERPKEEEVEKMEGMD